MQTITNLLSYVGYFFAGFAGVAALIGLLWFGLGVWNFIKIYYDVWRARREYAREEIVKFIKENENQH